jgi:hypothetical protein
MTSIKSLCSLTLDLPPSCIEFWPSDSEYAVVGTYNLEKQTEQEQADAVQDEGQKKSQSRNGSLILVHVDGDNVYVAMSDVAGMLANNLQRDLPDPLDAFRDSGHSLYSKVPGRLDLWSVDVHWLDWHLSNFRVEREASCHIASADYPVLPRE